MLTHIPSPGYITAKPFGSFKKHCAQGLWMLLGKSSCRERNAHFGMSTSLHVQDFWIVEIALAEIKVSSRLKSCFCLQNVCASVAVCFSIAFESPTGKLESNVQCWWKKKGVKKLCILFCTHWPRQSFCFVCSFFRGILPSFILHSVLQNAILSFCSTFQLARLTSFFFFFCICCDSYTLFLMFASDKSAAVFCEQNVIVVCCSFQETRCFCFLKPMARNLFVLGKPDLNTSLGTSLLHISFSLGVLCVLWMYWGSYFAICTR